MLSKRKQINRRHFSSQQRRYSGPIKDYTNPFFETKKKRTSRTNVQSSIPIKVKLIVLLILAVFVSIFWFIYYSKYFVIESVEARGGEELSPGDIEEIAWSQIRDSDFVLWQQKNIFIFNKEELLNTLNLKYSFNNIIISKKLPNKIIINYDEKEHSLIWLEKNIYYYTDLHGYVVDRIGDTPEEKHSPLIDNQSSRFIESTRAPVNQGFIDFAFILLDKLVNRQDMLIDRFIVEDDYTTLKIQIKDGPKLFFNIENDIDKQLSKIFTLKDEILKEDFYKKEYIDVRIGDSVYHR